MARSNRQRWAEQALALMTSQSKTYTTPAGEACSIADQLDQDDLVDWTIPRGEDAQQPSSMTLRFSYTTTLGACRTLHEAGKQNIAALNFASAKNPGGGFLSGAQAQEECLARCSGLYPTLTLSRCMEQYYNPHVRDKSLGGYYSHRMIYSPGVPVFANDVDIAPTAALQDNFIAPYPVAFVTSPAVNLGAMLGRRVDDTAQQQILNNTADLMRERMARILYLMELHNHRSIVLGAFGCGVFGNDVVTVSRIWRELLRTRFAHSFDDVVFAVVDRDKLEVMRREIET
ncbi:hypothetical protein RI367_007321 [Sorochytrium milnesiophthora]